MKLHKNEVTFKFFSFLIKTKSYQSSDPKVAQIQQDLDEVQGQMHKNIQNVSKNMENLETLETKTSKTV